MSNPDLGPAILTPYELHDAMHFVLTSLEMLQRDASLQIEVQLDPNDRLHFTLVGHSADGEQSKIRVSTGRWYLQT